MNVALTLQEHLENRKEHQSKTNLSAHVLGMLPKSSERETIQRIQDSVLCPYSVFGASDSSLL